MHQEPSAAEIASAPPDVLTLMLFQGAVRFGRQAQEALAADDAPQGAHFIGRVRAIVQELDRTLNHEAGELSEHLASIYEYLERRLAIASEDPAALEEVIRDLDEIGQTWAELVANRAADHALATA